MKHLGCDLVRRAVGSINPAVAGFEASCFDGDYITGDISDETVATMQAERGRANQEDDEDTSRLSLPNAEE